jgi:5-methylthioadenosine/S-adenosylhomocysteine deaminase
MAALNDLIIDDVTVITMDSKRRTMRNAAIVVESGAIVYVGPAAGVLEARAGELPAGELPAGLAERLERMPRLQGRGRIAIPGLVNAHTHAAMALFRGYADDLMLQEWLTTKIFPIEAKLTPDDVYWGTLLACAEMIKSGTTAFADMYFFMDEAAQAVEKSGIRASLSVGMGSLAGVADGADGGSGGFGVVLARGTTLCEKWHGAADGRITTMLGPHAPYTCSIPFLSAVGERARQLGVGVHTHISETFREVDEIRSAHDMSPVRYVESSGLFDAPTLAAHCVAVSDEDISILAEHGVRVAHNPGSNMKLASGVAPVEKMLAAGIAVGLGTDGAASNNNLDMIEEMRLAGLLHKVARLDPTAVPAHVCLEMATRGGAACLGLADQIGSIEVGKRADIVLLDFWAPHLSPAGIADPVSHLVYSASGADVSAVVVDGCVLMDDRKLTTLDEHEIMAEVERRAARLVQEANSK